MQKLELLAPARDLATGIEAIRHGADAVYIGADAFGARSAAGNPIADIKELCSFAHRFDARVYVTVNTIVYDSELESVKQLVNDLYKAEVDALIVQDMALLRLDIPPIALHASTQCDTRTPEKARFLEQSGFSQLVLARELSLDEISSIRRATEVPLEVFVHGALCVSYSGDCHAGALTMGRSANRGECPQICRLRYSLTDERMRSVASDGHWLSLRDMNRIDYLAALAEAGASSFKIEGRLKDKTYVKNVVAAYSAALDKLVDSDPGRWQRSSKGKTKISFRPMLTKAFNRGFTPYFLGGRPSAECRMAASATPKYVGQEAGTVLSVRGKRIKVRSKLEFNNGDGIVWFGTDGRMRGARVNRAEGQWLNLAENPADLQNGSIFYRNCDKAWDDLMSGDTSERTIAVKFTLRACNDGRVCMDASDERGNHVSAAIQAELTEARSEQQTKRRDCISRLGGTIYRAVEINDMLGNSFMPASKLTELRRMTTELLDRAQRLRFRPEKRMAENHSAEIDCKRLSYHSNVANRLAVEFYKSHGAESIESAAELRRPDEADPVVMTTRYCLRRELGQCIRNGSEAGSWYLKAEGGDFRLRADFDCSRCGMTLHLLKE